MPVLARLLDIIRVLRQRGLRFLWDYFRESIWFDLRHGTSTFSRVAKTDQAIDSTPDEKDDGVLYVASFTSVTRNTVRRANAALGETRARRAQFIDLGCGKGKALLVYAGSFGQEAVPPAIGIEYDPVLADVARANVAKLAFARGRVEIITGSATNLRQYLSADTAIVYLYNPFQGGTLDGALNALGGLPHMLIYIDPVERGKLDARGYRIVAEHAGRYNADTWLVAASPDLAPSLSRDPG